MCATKYKIRHTQMTTRTIFEQTKTEEREKKTKEEKRKIDRMHTRTVAHFALSLR